MMKTGKSMALFEAEQLYGSQDFEPIKSTKRFHCITKSLKQHYLTIIILLCLLVSVLFVTIVELLFISIKFSSAQEIQDRSTNFRFSRFISASSDSRSTSKQDVGMNDTSEFHLGAETSDHSSDIAHQFWIEQLMEDRRLRLANCFLSCDPVEETDCHDFNCNITSVDYFVIRLYSCCGCMVVLSQPLRILRYKEYTVNDYKAIELEDIVGACSEIQNLRLLPQLHCLKGSWDVVRTSNYRCSLHYTIIGSSCLQNG